MSTEKDDDKKAGKDDVLETAKRRFAIAEEFDAENRKASTDDWKFRSGDQWPAAIRREREAEGRPVITVNRILAPIRQVTNDQRQNRPSIKVYPVDDKSDVETAKIYQGMIRHIEQDSGADVAYDTAFEGAVVGGLGWMRVLTEYVDATAFDQQAKIGHIEDPLSVRFDPNSKMPDGSDGNWAFIETEIPKDDYVAEYGESELGGAEDWESFGGSHGSWIKKDNCKVLEYFYKEFKSVKVVQLQNGQVVDEKSLSKVFPPDKFPDGIPEGAIVNKKTAKVPVIKWCKLNSLEILEEAEWPGRWIPLIPVYGDKFIVEGKRVLEGIVRHAKDSNRMYNLWKSTETEAITLAPKAPFIVAEGQVPKPYEAQWKSANRKAHAYLVYKPTTLDGQLVPPPQRNVYEPPVQAITQAGLQAADDIKSTTGIFDPTLGSRSNETSGIAIQKRNNQAQTSNFHLVDNLTRSIRHVGRILVDLIPKIYDTARAARIIGEEGEEEIVRINQEFERKGEVVHYKMGVGTYDVAIDTGPNFATKRQEGSQSMLELSKSAPSIMQVAPDLIVKGLDIPGGQEIAERLKKTLPPGIADDKEQKSIPPEVQAQMQQMSQMVEHLTQELNSANNTLNTKQLDLDSKERIEAMKLEVQLLIAKMDHAKDFAEAEVERQLQYLGNIQSQQSQAPAPADQSQAQPDQPQNSMPSQAPNQPAGGPPPGAEEQS